MKRKLLFPVVVLVVSSIACSTFTRSTPESTVNVESTPTIETTMPQAEVVEAPTAVPAIDLTSITSAEDLPPLTFDEVLDARVESGEWTEGEGLQYIMKIFTGELSLQDDSELQSVYDVDATGIIMRLQEFISNPGNDSQIKTELETMLNNLIPSKEILDAISKPRVEGNNFKTASSIQSNKYQSVLCEDIRRFGFEELLSEDAICLEYIDLDVEGTSKIYYPSDFIGNPDMEELVIYTKKAMEESITHYSAYELLYNRPDINLYFQYASSGLEIAFKKTDSNGNCSISLFPEVTKRYKGKLYFQTIATYVFHCYEDVNFNPKVGIDDWWYFGAAEYFSNQVYPDANREHRNNKYFDLRSVALPIGWMKHENFVFFQYLGNRWGDFGLLTILFDKDISKNMHLHIDQEEFHYFVVDYLSIGILDSDKSTRIKYEIPLEEYRDTFQRKISEEGKLPIFTDVFVAKRFIVNYEKEKRFFQEIGNSDGEGLFSVVEAKLQQDVTAWSGPPPEIRSTCDEDKKYLYVVTDTTGRYEPPIEVKKVEEASCDPCLLGVWKVDNDSYSKYMMELFGKIGVDFTESLPEAGEIYMNITGDYFLGFKEFGEMGTWRNNFTISVGVPNVTTFDTVIQSAGSGNYSADGKFLTITDLYDQVISSKVYMGDSELPDSGSSDASEGYLFRPSYSADVSDEEPSQSGDKWQYQCDNNQLVINHDAEGVFVFARADELIPTPVPTETKQ